MKKIKEFVHRHARTVLPFCFVFMLLFSLAVPAYATAVTGSWELVEMGSDKEKMENEDFWNFVVDCPDGFSVNGTHYDGDFVCAFDCDGFYFEEVSDDSVFSLKLGDIVDFGNTGCVAHGQDFFTMFRQCALADENVIDDVFPIFTGIGTWIVSSVSGIMPMFYTEAEGLTFVGTLAVAALAIAVVLLLITFIRRFFQFRG